MNRLNRQFFRDTWQLTKPYWTSEDRWKAGGLLLAVIALTLFQVYLSVLFNYWHGDFWDAVQDYKLPLVLWLFGKFAILATLWIADLVYASYLQLVLTLRWRKWMTHHYLDSWTGHHAYYRMQLIDRGTDNPDQRIAEDVRDFPSQFLNLTLGLLNASVTFFSFVMILWDLSGSITIPLGSLQLVIPGYAVWVALIYSAIGTWLTLKIGKPLVGLYFHQQRFEADFRYSMVRIRENAESIALFGGEDRETKALDHYFGSVYNNFLAIIKRQKTLGWFTNGYAQAAVLVPVAVALPIYFAKKIQIGGIRQILGAFDSVQSSLSWVVNAYAGGDSGSIAMFQAIVTRLTGFRVRIEEVISTTEEKEKIRFTQIPNGLSVQHLDLRLPNGQSLHRGLSFELGANDMLLVTGPSGSGKSTLLRTVAKLWPYAEGSIGVGYQRPLFMPQKPYLPMGTLREIMLYPHGLREGTTEATDVLIRDSLIKVGLLDLADELDNTDAWPYRLSLGEQQRLNFARILIQKPDAVFMDEATSALDEPAEAMLYILLRDLPERPAVLSIAHRSTVRAFHNKVLDLGALQQPA